MKNLLQTHSLSWAESIRLALLAEGIEAVVLDQQSVGYLGFAGRARVAVLKDADLPRAQEVVRKLQPPKHEPLPSWAWHKRAIALFVMGFLLLIGASAIAGGEPPSLLAPVVFIISVLLLVGSLACLLRGYRADKEQL